MSHLILLLGAGGHARVVASGLSACGRSIAGCFALAAPDEGWPTHIPYLGRDERLADFDPSRHSVVIGVGSIRASGLRQRLFDMARQGGFTVEGLMHPSVILDPTATADTSSQIMAGAIVQAGAIIGANAIVNTGAIVEHGCRIAAHAHVATGAVLAGDVEVGEGAHVGAGATVLQGRRIGPGATVGAGACVTRDVAPGMTVTGIPARPHVARPDMSGGNVEAET